MMNVATYKNNVFFVFIIALCAAGGSYYVYKLQRKLFQEIELVREQKAAALATTKVIEKVQVAEESWSTLQSQVKNSVVQVFSQVAEINILQPFKSPEQYSRTGSAFFINDLGELITNAHVVNQIRAVWIQIPGLGKRQIDVDVVSVSPDRDLALLRVKPEELEIIKKELGKVPVLKLGDSDLVMRADEIMTLGFPLGQQGLKSTTGVVSGRENNLIQIDAPINPGNSGGPSINKRGEVIGVNTMYAPDAQNIGYIIPINELKIILADLQKVPLLRRPFLGVVFNNASDSLTRYLGNPLPGGLYVVDVYEGSPLHKAGIQRRDMIYEINGHVIDNYGELPWNGEKISLIDYVSQMKLGEKVTLVIYRNGEKKVLTLNFDQSELLPIRKIYPGYEKLDYEIIAGMVVQPLTLNHVALLVNFAPSLAKFAEMKYQKEPMLVVTHIFPNSQAQRSRSVAPGAIINEVNGVRIRTLDDFRYQLFQSLEKGEITIEMAEGNFVHFPFKKVIEDETMLAADWGYQITPAAQQLLAKSQPVVPVEQQAA